MYTESSIMGGLNADESLNNGRESEANGVTAILVSPIISDVQCIQFQYHMYGSNMGTLTLQGRVSRGAAWNTIWSATGQQQASSWDPWSVQTSQVIGYTRLRFLGERSVGYYSDFALDSILELGCVWPCVC